MRQATSRAEFHRSPIDSWIALDGTILWARSATLCGAICRHTARELNLARTLDCMEAFFQLAPSFDLVLDGSALTRIDPISLTALMEWTRKHFNELQARLRRRIGILPVGVLGLTLAGVVHVLGGPGKDELMDNSRMALRALLPDGGDALCDELEAISRLVDGIPAWLYELRHVLRTDRTVGSVADAARVVNLSMRSLQRGLTEQATSFRAELQQARFEAAEELLASGEKLLSVATRLGMSEAGLSALVRKHAGVTPGELRRRRSGDP